MEQIQSAAEAQRVKQVQAEQKAKEERDEEESKIHREEEETKKEQENIEAFRRKQAREMAEERAKNAKQQENIVDVSPKTAAPNQPAGSATSTVPLSGNAQNKTRLEFEKWHAKIIVGSAFAGGLCVSSNTFSVARRLSRLFYLPSLPILHGGTPVGI